MNYAELGSISHGTLRPEDLVDSFNGALRDLLEKNPEMKSTDMDALLIRCDQYLEEDPDNAEDSEEEGSELVSDLEDALSEFVPPCCYFGSHEGDGSDFGFWWNGDQYDDMVKSGEILVVPAGDKVYAEDAIGHQYISFVNDHGNIDLCTFEVEVKTKSVVSIV